MDKLYQNYDEWTRRSILYTASAGFFSSDRTINQYAKVRITIRLSPVSQCT